MAIPDQALAAEKKADEMLEKMINDETPGEETPDLDIEGEEKEVVPEGEEPGQEPGEEPVEGQEEDAPREDTVDYWKQRFKVVEGKLGEVTTLVDRVNSLTIQNAELSRLLTDARKPKEDEGDEEPPEDGQTFLNLMTEEEREVVDRDLGEDSLDIIGKVVQRIADDAVKPVKDNVETIHRETAKTKEEAYYDTLDAAFPDGEWERWNKDPNFNNYMATQKLPYTDTPYKIVLQEADRALDAGKVIEIINDYKKANDLPVSRKKPVPEKKPGPPKKQEHVDPKRGAGPEIPSTTTGDGKIWTVKEIREFYKDSAIGKKYTEEERLKIDKDISNAHLEGRIKQ